MNVNCDLWVSAQEFQFGQRVQLHCGAFAYIAKRVKIVGVKKSWISWKYSVVFEEEGKPGLGKITPVLKDNPVVWWEPIVKAPPVDDGTRQAVITEMAGLVSEKAKKKARAA